jgi:glutamine amidotransferase
LIAIVDYGMGNVRSVERAFKAVGAPAQITDDPEQISAADSLVLPGVGAFGRAMARLRESGLDTLLSERVLRDKVPFLGICLGMQLICAESHEHGHHEGLGWLDATVERLDPGTSRLRVPHIGWNDTLPVGDNPLIPESAVFYFVHSYRVAATDDATAATCAYGEPFAAALARDNIWATQFHPEKSQDAGLAILRRFSALTPSLVASA